MRYFAAQSSPSPFGVGTDSTTNANSPPPNDLLMRRLFLIVVTDKVENNRCKVKRKEPHQGLMREVSARESRLCKSIIVEHLA